MGERNEKINLMESDFKLKLLGLPLMMETSSKILSH